MRKLFTTISLVFFAVLLMGASTSDNKYHIKGKDASKDVELELGTGGNKIRVPQGGGDIEFSNDGGSSFKKIGAGGGAGGINLLEDNADCESGSPPTNWTESAGTFVAETGAPGFGLQSCSWDASAASQTLDTGSAFTTVPDGLENGLCNASIFYKYDTGSAGDYKLQVVANTGGLQVEADLPVSSDWRQAAVQFTCPSSDSLKLRIESTADGGVILIDNVTLGKTDFVDISQSELITHAYYVGTSNCVWTRDNSSFGQFNTDSDCPGITVIQGVGDVDTADDDLPTLVLQNLKPGLYTVDASWASAHASTATGVLKRWRLNTTGATPIECNYQQNNLASGTDDINQRCHLSFTVTQFEASRTIDVEAAENGTGTINIVNNGNGSDLSFIVRRYPTSSAEGINLRTVAEEYEGFIQSPSGDRAYAGPLAETSVGSITKSDMTLTDVFGNVAIACDGQDNTGTADTCSGADETLGVIVDLKEKADWEVCFQYSTFFSSINAANTDTVFSSEKIRMSDGDGTVNPVLGTETGGSQHEGASNATGIGGDGQRLCSTFRDVSGRKRFELYKALNLTTVNSNYSYRISSVTAAGAVQRRFSYRIRKSSQQFPKPVIPEIESDVARLDQGLHTIVRADQSFGPLRFVAAKITNSGGAPVLGNEFGAANNWISSITDNGVGNWDINFRTGVFNPVSNVVCSCTSNSISTTCSSNIGTTLSDIQIFDMGGSAVDRSINVHCFGVKGTLD